MYISAFSVNFNISTTAMPINAFISDNLNDSYPKGGYNLDGVCIAKMIKVEMA